jgi:hypothetical protein
MTAIRIEEQPRTILDFSSFRCSKNSIKQALKRCPITNIIEDESSGELTVFLNEIKIGMYTIALQLPPDTPFNCTKNLKDYGDFEISITDSNSGSRINLKKDVRFKNQYWVPFNFFGKLRVKHLIDIIAHCKRLDKLKAFL